MNQAAIEDETEIETDNENENESESERDNDNDDDSGKLVPQSESVAIDMKVDQTVDGNEVVEKIDHESPVVENNEQIEIQKVIGNVIENVLETIIENGFVNGIDNINNSLDNENETYAENDIMIEIEKSEYISETSPLNPKNIIKLIKDKDR